METSGLQDVACSDLHVMKSPEDGAGCRNDCVHPNQSMEGSREETVGEKEHLRDRATCMRATTLDFLLYR